ncbi:hypothetical protein RF55_14283 [Lasius niger]|uniref:Retrotransposon gag domain-containing protein n=1 Tax=Lasius niger TaxID=67767 RepID=A0A0J7K8C6_LASNI|nr:hypothetical protein RF55_14283 [Lasius niger]
MATPAPQGGMAVGQIEEFQPGIDASWTQYIERLDFQFIANEIDNPVKKRAILLSVCGKATYALIRSVVMPKSPADLSFDEIVQKVGEHFTPKPSEIIQRFKFNKRSQTASESVADYVADLRRLSEHCGFETTLDSMLQDRLVCGIADEAIQRRLLAETDVFSESARHSNSGGDN